MKLATDFLREGGSFITKIFRSRDYNSLLWVFNQLFRKVEATKPPSSRDVSAEIFVVCLDFKAPKKIDPRLLDPKSVFAELAEPAPNNEAKVFNPEVKKRKRGGYEEGDYLQYHEAPVSEFIQTSDPIAMLGSMNKLSFEHKPNGDLALAALERLPETTEEIRKCCDDLRVLGKKDFRVLLRWRLKVRDKFGFSQKKKSEEEGEGEEVAAVESMDEELREQEEMQRLKDLSDSRKKKDKRRENERKRREIVRMQMNMATPEEIGLEQDGPMGEDSMFGLKQVERVGAVNQVARGRMHTVTQKAPEKPQSQDDEDDESDEEGDNLEAQLDAMYEQYQERRAETDPKYKAKKARTEHDDDFEGFSDGGDQDISSDEEILEDNDSDDEEDEAPAALRAPSQRVANGLSNRAAMFFDQDIFKGIEIPDEPHDDSGIELDDSSEDSHPSKTSQPTLIAPTDDESEVDDASANASPDDEDFEVVSAPQVEESWEEHAPADPEPNGRPDVDIITAEAMTLAHALATGKTTKAALQDDNFNRYTLRDTDGLPEWFLDDEGQHSKLQRPITKAAADAIKEKLRALNARPIKKVAEAQARKKFKAAQKLEKLKRKSALLIEDGDMTEADKAQAIGKMMSKAAKKKPRKQVSVVVAAGANRGLSGRPRGTKGKYKMVDARLKKDTRALKRLAKKRK